MHAITDLTRPERGLTSRLHHADAAVGPSPPVRVCAEPQSSPYRQSKEPRPKLFQRCWQTPLLSCLKPQAVVQAQEPHGRVSVPALQNAQNSMLAPSPSIKPKLFDCLRCARPNPLPSWHFHSSGEGKDKQNNTVKRGVSDEDKCCERGKAGEGGATVETGWPAKVSLR